MRFIRGLGLTAFGVVAGITAAAAVVKRALPSQGDPESEKVALVAILDGVELASRATPFRGGSMFAWLGGIAVDLREATLAPDAHITLAVFLGGIAIRVPPGWRIESKVRPLGGGVAIGDAYTHDEAAPRLVLDGLSVLGGISVGAKASNPRGS